MTFTPILHAPQVAPNQNQKEATINTAMAVFEAACNDEQSISLAAGNRTLSTDEFTKFFHTTFTDHTGARVVTIPATVRFFATSNKGTGNITLHCQGSAGLDLVVPADKRVLVLSDGTDVVAITSGISALAELSDVIGAGAGEAGNKQVLGYDSTGQTWGPIDQVSEHGFFQTGAPASSQRLYRRQFTRAARFLSNFDGAVGRADVAATAQTDFAVYKNGTQVGYIRFAAAGAVATFSTDMGSGSVSVTFNIGDYLTIVAPASADATLADVNGTLLSVLI